MADPTYTGTGAATPAVVPTPALNLPPALKPASSINEGNPLDMLGRALWGQGNGSVLGGVPVLGDIGRFTGEAASNVAGASVGIGQIVAGVPARIPIGYLPGGADEQFRNYGAALKVTDPKRYAEWQIADAHAGADFFGGSNIKADFNAEEQQRASDASYAGGGYAPTFTMPGSLGGALGQVPGLLNLSSEASQKAQAGINQAPSRGDFTRIGRIYDRRAQGLELNDVEQTILDQLDSGKWSRSHAEDYLIEQGQGLSRDFVPQMALSIATDPLTYLTAGIGPILKLGTVGARAIELAGSASKALETGTTLEKAAVILKVVQTSPLAPAFKVTRTLFDPFSLLGKRTATKGLVDLTSGIASQSVERAYGADTMSAAFKIASKLGFTADLQSAIGGYAANTARTWTVIQHRATELLSREGEQLAEVVPGSVVDTLMKSADKDALTRLTDHMQKVRTVFTNAADDATLVRRMTSTFGRDAAAEVAKMSENAKSFWHALTYERTWRQFEDAMAKVGQTRGELNVDRLTILNDSRLDDVGADELLTALTEADGIAAKVKVWDAAADKFGDIADIGRGEPSQIRLDQLETKLRQLLDEGHLHRRATAEDLADPALKPLIDFLDAQIIDGQPLWHLGFRPADEQLWGFVRDEATGKLRIGYDPYVSHVTDGIVPAVRPFNDVARNFLGQVIGPRLAGAAARPIEAVEVAVRVASDIVSGQRLIENMNQRFVVNMAKHGISARDAKRLFGLARDAAQLQKTTIQGVSPTNVWAAVKDVVEKEGLKYQGLNQYTLMTELLDAAGGDMRIMGLTSGFSQRVRTMLERTGLGGDINFAGALTVNFYRQVRYSLNPAFFIQRVTDGNYFLALHGIHPVGFGEFKEGSQLAQVQKMLAKVGETASARDFAMDLPEYQLRSDFQQALRGRLDTIVGPKFGNIAGAATRWQRNSQVADVSAHLGDIVREALDEAKATMQKAADAATGAEKASLQNAIDGFWEFGAVRKYYNDLAGKALSDTETGLRYIQEMFSDSLGQTVTQDGLVQFRHDILAGTYHRPVGIGELRDLNLDTLAVDVGYADAAALRQAVSATGERSQGWLREVLAGFSADPDYIDRAVKGLTFNWRSFWDETAVTMKLTPKARGTLEGIIAREAKTRGMTPSVYLSQVLQTNLGTVAVHDHFGQLLNLVQGGDQQVNEAMAAAFTHTLDRSGQRLLEENGGLLDIVTRLDAGAKITNPDVAAVVRHFTGWIEDLGKGTPGSALGKMAGQLADRIPLGPAYAYNRSEALIEQLLKQKIDLAQRDAFRLAEMSTQRTVASRTLNHPLFAMYPTSYMWGKVLPETIKFLAKEPFGFETPVLAITLAKVEAAIAARQEYDPEFDKTMRALSGSSFVFLTDYLTPSLPWSDFSARTPPWLQSIAKSGLDLGKITESEMKTIDPRRWVKQFARAGSEALDFAQNLPTPAPELKPLIQSSSSSTTGTPAPTGVPAQLTPPLTDALDELKRMFQP
jgi:hypothetical protein